MKEKWVLITLLLAQSLLVIYLYSCDELKENIENGDLLYSRKIGWINWRHAIPQGTMDAYQNFQSTNVSQLDSTKFTYSQSMKMKIGAFSVVAKYEECRWIKSNLTVSQQRQAFTQIFKSVSTSFEEMQGQFPLNLLPGSNDSSFREGDLTGNAISLYCAITGTDISNIKNNIDLYDAKQSYEVYLKSGLRKVDWRGLSTINGYSHERSPFSEILNNAEVQFSRIVSKKSTIYFD